MATLAEPIVHGKPVESELKVNTLSLFDTTVIATSSVAPAYTLAATVGFLVAAVGLASPAAILVGFLPVLCVAIAYYYLNRQDPNCGASYSWVSRTLSPHIGWIGGWIQLAANVLFCAAAPLVAGAYTLQLLNSLFPSFVNSNAASNNWLIAIIGIAWLLLVTFMVVRGIRITANFQWILVFIEYFIVLGFAITAFLKIIGGQHAAAPFSASWFSPGSLGGISGVATGSALAVFFFWGWDTAANVNEESKDASESPGLAGIYSMFILLFIFLVAATAMQAFLGSAALTNSNNQNDVLYFFAQQISGTPIAYLMVLAVLSSTVATTQTTLLPSSRLTYSMARDGVFPRWFGHIHPSWRTPWVGTIISSILAIVVIVLQVQFADSVGSIFGKLILDIGVLVALYYGITGIACTWAFRKVLLTSVTRFIFAGVLPFLGGLFLLGIAYVVIAPTSLPLGQAADWGSGLPIIVTILIGIPLVIIAQLTTRSTFFSEKTVSYVLLDGRLVSALDGGSTMELAGATIGGLPEAPSSPADPTAQSRSSNE
ncbi:MAG TPA: APC family permease [Candidatus Saccharimonadales bacterium]|nr:APC family permease [Candidatus Saccharimonadales bacterium]